jgi:hypothetical protein
MEVFLLSGIIKLSTYEYKRMFVRSPKRPRSLDMAKNNLSSRKQGFPLSTNETETYLSTDFVRDYKKDKGAGSGTTNAEKLDMTRKSSVIFIISIIFLISIFGWGIWKEINSGGNDFQKELENSIAKNYLMPGSGSPVSSQTNSAPNPPKPSASPDRGNSANELNPESSSAETSEDEVVSGDLEDKTKDWKVFKEEKDGFEFKYPSSTDVADNGDSVVISQDGKPWRIKIYNDKKKEELEAWFNSYFDEKERKGCAFTESDIQVGTYVTKQLKPGSDPEICQQDGYYAANSEKTKVVKIRIGKETVENVNNILATFKFID